MCNTQQFLEIRSALKAEKTLESSDKQREAFGAAGTQSSSGQEGRPCVCGTGSYCVCACV